MGKTKYFDIFGSFEKVPMDEFLKTIFNGISSDSRKKLVLEDVSYHRLNADIVTLEAWMCVAPIESNRWIWVRVEKNTATDTIQETYFTKDNYRKEALPSLQACIDYYKEEKK